jgi:hypothetical protein
MRAPRPNGKFSRILAQSLKASRKVPEVWILEASLAVFAFEFIFLHFIRDEAS